MSRRLYTSYNYIAQRETCSRGDFPPAKHILICLFRYSHQYQHMILNAPLPCKRKAVKRIQALICQKNNLYTTKTEAKSLIAKWQQTVHNKLTTLLNLWSSTKLFQQLSAKKLRFSIT